MRRKKLSKTTIKNLTDDECRCYVCKNKINDLIRVRTLANKKHPDAYFTDRAFKLRQKVNQKVLEITGCNDNYRVYRHSFCNPVDHTFTAEDL